MFQPEYESMARPDLERLQFERLAGVVRRVYDNVDHYRRAFDDAGVSPELESLADLARLPFTLKDDLRAAYPYNLFAVPLRDIVRVHSSSGTTGQITVVGYTKNDIDNWADLMARTLAAAGATPDDVVQVTYGYGLFTGGLGAHYGSERLGCVTIPISGGNTKRQVQVMKDFGTTVLACTPS
ncbi:phenylacetate--CoA ligase, partial [bacterium]|nr:phenylacetate--CoA ligase [bacterium]